METRKKIKIFTWLFALISIGIAAIFAVIFGLVAKERQTVNSELTILSVGVPNYSYAVNNDDSGSFDIFLTDNSGNLVKPESIDSFICDKAFIAKNGESKSVIVKTRVDANGSIHYSVDNEYTIEDAVNKFDIVKLTVGVTYQGKSYTTDINLRVTATPNYSLKFYYNTQVGDYRQGPCSDLLIGAGNKIDLAVSDANANGADIDLDTKIVAKELLNSYEFDGWYILDSDGNSTRRKLDPNDYFDISDLHIQEENDGIKNVAVVAQYKTQLLLDDDMGERRYLALNGGEGSFVSNKQNAADIYFNEQFPINRSYLPRESSKNGWTFVDWYSEPAGEIIDYLDDSGRFIMKNPHLYAKWKGDIKLDTIFETIDFGSESAVIDRSDVTNTTLIIPNVTYRSDVILPTLNDVKYSHGGSFVGWYTRNGENDVPVSGHEFVLNTDTRIYAKVNFDIELDNQGTSVSAKNAVIEYGYNDESLGTIVGSLPYPQNTVENGWKFEKWNTTFDGTGDTIEAFWNINPYELSNPNKSDLILYAKRSTNLYLYRQIDVNGLSTVTPETKTIYYNRVLTDAIIPSSLPDINGWHYNGYYKVDNKDLSTKVITLTDSAIKDTDVYIGPGELEIGANWSADVLLNTIFKGTLRQSVVYNQAPNFPTEISYVYGNGSKVGTFMGWYIDGKKIDNSVAFQYALNNEIYAKVKFPLELNYRLMAPSDKTYYIIYGDNKEDRSGVGELETKLPEELDKKFNWSFVNWNTENNGSGSSIVDTWEINPYENVLSLYDNWSIDLNIYRKLDEQGQYSREKLKVITVKYGAHPEIPTTLEAEGWTYEGCYKTLGHDDAKILTTTPYISRDGETDLFCQWSRKITLKITDVSTDENKNTTIKVIYDVIPTELAAVNPEYDKGGQLSGWYSLPYGNGEQVFTDSAFTLTKCDTLYNKIIFRISMDPFNGLNKEDVSYGGYENYSVTYGKSLRESGILSFVSPASAKWDFKSWYLILNGKEQSITESLNVALTGKDIISKVTTNDDNSAIKVCAKWSCEVTAKNMVDVTSGKLKDCVFTAYNNETVNISQSAWGDWAFVGWYEEMDATGNCSGVIDNNYLGVGHTVIYGKWTCTSYLKYNSDHPDGNFSFIYGINSNLPHRGDGVTNFGYRGGYTDFIIWSSNPLETYKTYLTSEDKVNEATRDYPKNMLYLYAVWQPKSYTVNFYDTNFSNEKGDKIGDITVQTGEYIGLVSTPSSLNPFKKFSGYFYNNDTQYTDANGYGCRPWDIYEVFGVTSSSVDLVAKYNFDSSEITLDKQGGDEGTSKIVVSMNSTLQSSVSIPIKTGHIFKGYFTEINGNGDCYYDEYGNCRLTTSWNGNTNTLYAKWDKDKYVLTINQNHVSITVQAGDTRISSGQEVEYGTKLKITYSVNNGWHDPIVNWDGTGISSGTEKTMPAKAISITSSATEDTCVATGTLITLADGSQIPVEELAGDEMLLVWNIYTGNFDMAPILFIDSDDETTYEIINLYFSDGTSVKVISEHGFWDYDLNKWVFLRNDAAKYIGHWFNKQGSDKVQLTDVVITEEVTTSWSPVTFGHLCYYVNGILSMPGATEGFINIFDVNPETMKVDEAKMTVEIEEYGLFTYEDFAEYIPEEVFYAFNGQYLKVAMGKGLLTWDDIYALIDRYQQFWQ